MATNRGFVPRCLFLQALKKAGIRQLGGTETKYTHFLSSSNKERRLKMNNSASMYYPSNAQANVLISEHFSPSIPHKRGVVKMNDIKNWKIVLDNQMIGVLAKLDKTSLKLFELITAAVDVKNPPKDGKIILDKFLIYDVLNIKASDRSRFLQDAIMKLSKQAVFKLERKTSNNDGSLQTVVIGNSEQTENGSTIIFDLTKGFLERIVGLKKDFTQIDFGVMVQLEGKYSNLIYMLLKSHYNKYIDRNEENAKNPSFGIEELRELTGTEDKYKEMHNFTNRVLKDAQKEINESSDIRIEFKKIRRGNTVKFIQFSIVEKPRMNNDNPMGLMLSPERHKAELKEEANKARESLYTNQLAAHGLLSVQEVLNNRLMIELGRQLYPIYDSISKESKEGIAQVGKHIERVDEHRDGEIVDVVSYLKTAAKNYLHRLKIEKKEV